MSDDRAVGMREEPIPTDDFVPYALLAGIRVVDLTRLYPFASSTQLLADLGAEVIKVEPLGGEPGRLMTPLFNASNNGKRSITLDIWQPEGAALFKKLCRTADVVIDNFRPGVLRAVSLGPEELRVENAALVTCSISGYGDDGPRRDVVGHDINFFGMSGGALPLDGVAPAFASMPIIDPAVAFFAPYCVTAGVLHARKTGRGEHIDLAMNDVAFSMNAASYLLAIMPDPSAHRLPWPEFIQGVTAGYGAFEAQDGLWLTVGNLEPKFWATFVNVLGCPDILDDQLATGPRGAEVRAQIAGIIASKPRAYWLRTLGQAGTCVAPVLSTVDAGNDEQIRARWMVYSADGWTRVGFPARIGSGTSVRGSSAPAPDLGEANREIFGALGVAPSQFDELVRSKVVGA